MYLSAHLLTSVPLSTGMSLKATKYAGCARAQVDEPAPRSWAYRHLSDNGFSIAENTSLQLELTDPIAYLERHKAALGHNAPNFGNIAPEASRDASPSLARAPLLESEPAAPCNNTNSICSAHMMRMGHALHI